MLTAKQYKQKWLHFRYKNQPLTKARIWYWQKSILISPEEIDLCGDSKLKLPRSDPRWWVLQESERAYDQAPMGT